MDDKERLTIKGVCMDSPYWIREAADLWMPYYEVLKRDFVIVRVDSRNDAEKVLWELNCLFFSR